MVRRVIAVLVLVVVTGACADDGNDGWVGAGERTTISVDPLAEVAAIGVPSSSSDADALPDDEAASEPSSEQADATDLDEFAAETGDSLPAPPQVEPTGVEVRIIAIDNLFRPDVVEVMVGDDVVWENRGMNEHDIVSVVGPAAVAGASAGITWTRAGADGLEWGVSADGFQPGATFRVRFAEPGEYRYYCSVHGNERVGMPGVVRVVAAD